jgi:hypothetical protein
MNHMYYTITHFTPLRIENAQSALSCAESSSLITAPEGGVLNERRCKNYNINHL